MIIKLLLCLGFLSIIDLTLTYIGIKYFNMVEINPLIKSNIDFLGLEYGILFSIIEIIIYSYIILKGLEKTLPIITKLCIIIIFLAIVLRVIVIISNFNNIYKALW